MEISCIKIEKEHQQTLYSSLGKIMQVNNLQTYFPILSIYFNFINNSYSYKSFTLNSRYILNEIIDKIECNTNFKDGYIKFLFNGRVLDRQTDEILDQKIFIKVSSILDVSQFIMNEYNRL